MGAGSNLAALGLLLSGLAGQGGLKTGLRIRIHFIRIQHFRLKTDPDPIRIQGLNDRKLDLKREHLTLSKHEIF